MSPLLHRHPPEEDLVALLDRELPPAERRALEQHLAACARCADLSARLDRALAALRMQLALDAVEQEAALAWRLRPGVPVLAGSVGALVLAGLLVRRYRRPVVQIQGAA